MAIMEDQENSISLEVQSGTENRQYGVWKNRCCGDEIVLYRGATFPMCNKHQNKPTEWALISVIAVGTRGMITGGSGGPGREVSTWPNNDRAD